MQHYQDANKTFPPSFCWSGVVGDPGGNWSALARILPYVEEAALEQNIDYSRAYDKVHVADDPAQPLISSLRISLYLCPSEIQDRQRLDSAGVPLHYPLNYGVNLGVWKVFDPVTRKGGEGAFHPNSSIGPQAIRDGTSHTLMAAEVKAYTPYFRNAQNASETIPTVPASLCSMRGEFKGPPGEPTGHTEWLDGKVHQTGFTATFPPNTRCECTEAGQTVDVDWTNQQEGRSDKVVTYAAVTARSYHAGMVNVVMMDGSVHSISDQVALGIWQALATRAGREVVSDGAW
jgi:prepilin-type processing-associated H-X9-DG protein